jgi:flagellar biosynthetic protein FliQ
MEGDVILLFQQALYYTLIAVTIIILPGLVTGFLISMLQAATQINETTLSFLPKLLVMLFVIALFAPWLFSKIVAFTEYLVSSIPYVIG